MCLGYAVSWDALYSACGLGLLLENSTNTTIEIAKICVFRNPSMWIESRSRRPSWWSSSWIPLASKSLAWSTSPRWPNWKAQEIPSHFHLPRSLYISEDFLILQDSLRGGPLGRSWLCLEIWDLEAWALTSSLCLLVPSLLRYLFWPWLLWFILGVLDLYEFLSSAPSSISLIFLAIEEGSSALWWKGFRMFSVLCALKDWASWVILLVWRNCLPIRLEGGLIARLIGFKIIGDSRMPFLVVFPVLHVDGWQSRFIILRGNKSLQINPRLIFIPPLIVRALIFTLLFCRPTLRWSLFLPGG